MLRKKERDKAATQHNTIPETTFSKEKAALRWDSNTRFMLSRCDAFTN